MLFAPQGINIYKSNTFFFESIQRNSLPFLLYYDLHFLLLLRSLINSSISWLTGEFQPSEENATNCPS